MAIKEDTIKDYDSKPLTIADVQEQTRIYLERISTNRVSLAGVVRGKNISEPKPKIDKRSGDFILNDDGSQAYWSPYHYVSIAFEGGELDVQVEAEWYASLQVGNRVLFDGCKGIKFGKVADVFHSYTVL